jgi:hypothetical protein
MRRFTALGLLLFILTLTTSALAWELNLAAEYEMRYRYYSRTGANDLFGNVNAAQSPINTGSGTNSTSTTIGFSGPHGGTVVPEGISSKGSDGSRFEQRFWLFPEFKITPAVKVMAEYAFQGNPNGLYQGGPNWTNPQHYAGWMSLTSRPDDGNNSIAVGVLRALWIEAQIPWGKVSVGRMPFGFGTGWSGFHYMDYHPAILSLTVPYGPLQYMVGTTLADTGENSDPYDTRNVNMTPLTLVSTFDKNEQKQWDFWASLRYLSGNVDIGLLDRLSIWNKVHGSPFVASSGGATTTLRDDVSGAAFALLASGYVQQGAGQNGTTQNNLPMFADIYFNTAVLYLKYNNGRFFFNGEWDQQWLIAKKMGGRTISGKPYSWMVEMGGMAGPAKTTLAAFYRTGHQRSGGQLNFASSNGSTGITNVSDKWNQYVVVGGANTAIAPYNFLIGYWGTGNNSYDASGYPTYLDFLGYAARIDYALASNLNLFTSYIYARRASSSSTGWGQYGGGVALLPVNAVSSNVPDNNLGWEWDLGCNWKLLESMTFNFKFGYWKPGDWFKFAYMDLSTTNTITDPAPGGGSVRVNPSRSIDPIIGTEFSLLVNF